MRLVDADKIRYAISVDEHNVQIAPAILDEYDINSLPTVNAIPTRWIKTWGRRHNQKELTKQLLNDWREFDKGKL